MSTIERNRYVERSPFFWIGDAVAKLSAFARAKARERRHRKALLELREMEDWQLRDIGVSRSAVEDALFSRK
ncbi:DUF1127 domain-containing protein [Pelagibacterium xiamenense]|uniref:DUF1127 domain-containing protein n=1 Tax=Pelagibacterium xiamenense TaxID=2901140 RepID=UPI001E4CD1F7|nr:DUF1127 domain-containing protein [Pelagibacterium xiamenense]MCD7059775.1 DUF1127 domain-containing protein [Pelagibacterium xiamenense]